MQPPMRPLARGLVLAVALLLGTVGLSGCTITPARLGTSASGTVDGKGFSLAIKGASATATKTVAKAGTAVTLADDDHSYTTSLASDVTPLGRPIRLRLAGDQQPAAPITLRFKIDQSKVSKANWSSPATYAVETQSAGSKAVGFLPATYDAKTGEIVATTGHLSWFTPIQVNLGHFFSGVGDSAAQAFGLKYPSPACPRQGTKASYDGIDFSTQKASSVSACLDSDDTALIATLHSLSGEPYSARSTPAGSAKASPVLDAGGNFSASWFSILYSEGGAKLLAPGESLTYRYADDGPKKITLTLAPEVLLLTTLMSVAQSADPGDPASKAKLDALATSDCMAGLMGDATDETSPTQVQFDHVVSEFLKCSAETALGAFWNLVVALPSLLANFVIGIVESLTSNTVHIDISASAPQPVLASKNAEDPTNSSGFGEVRPSSVFNGGDPTGLVEDITWQSWGGATAVGYGKSCDAESSDSVADCPIRRAEIIASNLGTCDGKRAYEDVGWFFPGHDTETEASAEGDDVWHCNSGPDPQFGEHSTFSTSDDALAGFGIPRPSRITLNLETAGLVGITWSNWGDPMATGEGKSCGENDDCTPVTITASNLGQCDGDTAYEDATVTGYFGRGPMQILRDCMVVAG